MFPDEKCRRTRKPTLEPEIVFCPTPLGCTPLFHGFELFLGPFSSPTTWFLRVLPKTRIPRGTPKRGVSRGYLWKEVFSRGWPLKARLRGFSQAPAQKCSKKCPKEVFFSSKNGVFSSKRVFSRPGGHSRPESTSRPESHSRPE